MADIQITLESEDLLDVRRFVITEMLNGIFRIDVWARSANPNIDLEAATGRRATFRIDTGRHIGPLGGTRFFSGIVQTFELVYAALAASNEQSTYRVQLVPALWVLSQRTNFRLFQDTTIPAIVETILKEWKIPYEFQIDQQAYPVLETRCQYGESDLNFLFRLLEEAGIAFFFPDSDADSKVVFHDQLGAAPPRAKTPIPYLQNPSQTQGLEYVTQTRLSVQMRPGAQTIVDYDFLRPNFALSGALEDAKSGEKKLESYEYKPGRSIVRTEGPSTTPGADARGRYRHDDAALRHAATLALEAARTGRRALTFEITTVDLQPGMVVTLANHPEVPTEVPLLCTFFSITGAPGETWIQRGVFVPTDVPYRPARITPKPTAHGVQTALVVGPPKTEILTDEHGRVRVQFHWDRLGIRDEKSSAWLRVSHGWAGAGYGWIAVPRIGQEVLIAFLDGNPDMPMVVGRVFNRTNPVPYKLPDKATRSTDRSDSSVGSGGTNELMFEDAAAKELVYKRAQKNLRVLVKNDEVATVGVHRDKFVQVDETETTLQNRTQVTKSDRVELTDGYRTESNEQSDNKLIYGSEFELIEEDRLTTTVKERHEFVQGVRRELVIQDSHLEIKGNKNERVGGLSVSTGGERHIQVGKPYLLKTGAEVHLKTNTDLAAEAPDLTLKGPGGFVRIDGSGVTIVGAVVKINDGGSPGSGPGAKPGAPELPREALVQSPVKPSLKNAGLGDAEFPPGPEVPVFVSIKAEGGLKGGCRFIASGKSHTYEAVGSPDGGTYKWTAKGGITITGDATKASVTVLGSSVSATLDDSELTVEYTLPSGKAQDSLKVTVYEFTEIEAKLRSTPCRRTKNRTDTNLTRKSTTDSKTIDNTTLSVVRGGGEVKLKAVTRPADVPVTWFVERAADDAPALSGIPTHAMDGGSEKRALRTDATGTFHVHAFVDCDGDGKRGPEETGLIFNIHMVLIEVLPGIANNKQFKRDSLFAATTGTHLVVHSGTPSWSLATHNAVYGDEVYPLHAQGVRLGIRLTGGGADQRRGVDKIQTGVVRIATADTFRGVYADGRTLAEVVVEDGTVAGPITAGTPVLLGYPVRDCRGATTAGLDVFGSSSTDAGRSNLPDGGQKRMVRNIDSPAVIVDMKHPVTGSALASISGVNSFACIVVAYSTDLDETFTVVALSRWTATYGTYSAASGWTNAKAKITGDDEMVVFHPAKRGEDVSDLERCLPNFVHNLRMDAR